MTLLYIISLMLFWECLTKYFQTRIMSCPRIKKLSWVVKHSNNKWHFIWLNLDRPSPLCHLVTLTWPSPLVVTWHFDFPIKKTSLLFSKSRHIFKNMVQNFGKMSSDTLVNPFLPLVTFVDNVLYPSQEFHVLFWVAHK